MNFTLPAMRQITGIQEQPQRQKTNVRQTAATRPASKNPTLLAKRILEMADDSGLTEAELQEHTAQFDPEKPYRLMLDEYVSENNIEALTNLGIRLKQYIEQQKAQPHKATGGKKGALKNAS